MLIKDVFDSLSDHLEKGFSCYRKMRGTDPNGFNYDMLENFLNVTRQSYMNCLEDHFDHTLLERIERQCQKKGQQVFSADFLNDLMETYMEERFAKPRYFFDMDGVLFKLDNTLTSLEPLYEEGYFKNLPTHRLAVRCLQEMLIQDPEQVYILSHYIDSPFAEQEKREVLQELFPSLDMHNVILVPYGESKTDYVPIRIKENDFLVDDYNHNLECWRDAGGYAIKFVNAINDRHGSWIGSKVEYDDPELNRSLNHIFENAPMSKPLEMTLEPYMQQNWRCYDRMQISVFDHMAICQVGGPIYE